jgi:hypothetical protein
MTYYMIQNFITGVPDFVTSEAEADALAKNNKLAWLAQEAYRFTVARIIVEGNDTTWTAADLDQDPENGFYAVFNTMTGQHEEFLSKTAAWARLQEIQDEFLAQYFPAPWQEVTEEFYQHMTAPQQGGIPVTQL